MSSAVTRAGQKWKEFWGQQITKNKQLEEKQSEAQELNNYFQMAEKTLVTISQCHQQLQIQYNQCAMIVTKLFEHEIGSNKLMATNLVKMFQKISELHGEKVAPIYQLKLELKPWFITMEQIKILLERYQEDRLIYDHYKQKIKDLQNSQDSEKITRNERKLEKATNTYQNICIDMMGKMDNIISNKITMMNVVLSSIISIEHDVSSQESKHFQECLDFDKEFSNGNDNSKIQAESQDQNNDFINKTRKLLSQQSTVNSKQNDKQNPIKLQQQFGETPTANPDFDEFNSYSAKIAREFQNDSESPALCKNSQIPKQNPQQKDIQDQQQQKEVYQAIKNQRKWQDQPEFKQQNKTDMNQEEQNLFTAQQKYQDQQQYQSINFKQNTQWNPFENNQDNGQTFKKNIHNPFEEKVDDNYAQQQQQIKSQIISSRSNNPFISEYNQQPQPPLRMFQTYQPSNPFDEYTTESQKQYNQNTSKNPFI